MKRLIDETGTPEAEHVAALVGVLRDRSVPAHLATRVRARVDGRTPPHRRALRPFAVLVALLLFAIVSAASAMVLRRIAAPAPSAPAAIPPPPSRAHGSHAPVVMPLPVPIATPEPATPPVTAPVTREHRRVPVAPPPSSWPTTDPAESQLLLDAYSGLRREGGRETALRKIDDYLTLYPRGLLVEEALTLALEACEGDPVRGEKYAKAYLARFPAGRQVERARALIAPSP